MQETLDLNRVPKATLKACAHCGLPTMSNKADERVFCCSGCMGAFAMIHELGLEEFYALRSNAVAPTNRTNESRAKILDDLDAAGVQVRSMEDGLCAVRLSVDGVHCAACSWLIERMQPTIRGLKSAQVRMSDHTVELIYDPAITQPSHVSRRLAKFGYGLSPWTESQDDEQAFVKQQHEHWTGIALAAFFASNAMWIGIALYAGEATGIAHSHETFLRWMGTGLAILSVVFPGRVFFQTAWQAIRTRTPHIDIPVALSVLIGIVGAVVGAISGTGQIYFDSLASLILLLRVGRYIQFRAQYRTSHWVSQLLRTNAGVANRVETDGSLKIVPAYRLKVGDQVLVGPGETIPADGIVIADGNSDSSVISSIDMSLVSGESAPLSVREGDCLIGGTTNLSSPIRVAVTAAGESSRVGRLMEVVRNATTHRTPWVMAADRVSKWFVLAVLVLSVVTWLTWTLLANATTATEHTMALLTIACPCALALAAPLVLTVALGRAAKKQIWIRDGNCLEKLATPGTIWLDKTGTLTYGRMSVLAWHGTPLCLPYAAALEQGLQHPIAIAIDTFASQHASSTQENLVPTAIEYVHGKGVRGRVQDYDVCIGSESWMVENDIPVTKKSAQLQLDLLSEGMTPVWVAMDGKCVGIFGIGDSLREETTETLRAITARGWRIGILSGDRQEIVDRCADRLTQSGLKISEVRGEQLPEDKLEVIRRSKLDSHGPCVMIGDGINDAAAMALADVGIAIRGGSDIALHAAPIYLANQKLSSVVDLIDASQGVVRGIRRCFIASLLYNSITIALAITGFIHPLIAAILMPISGLTVLAMAILSHPVVRLQKS